MTCCLFQFSYPIKFPISFLRERILNASCFNFEQKAFLRESVVLESSSRKSQDSLFGMGFAPPLNPSNAFMLWAILIFTSIMQIVRSTLQLVSIHNAPRESHSQDHGHLIQSYIEEFQMRTPAIRYGSMNSCPCKIQECIVCLIELKPEAEIYQLNCGHIFHKTCLEKWIKYMNITCPLCRSKLLPEEDEENNPM